MNLKERMQHQNKNNSSILNNSNFNFEKGNRDDQMYEKSRRECEEQLYKRKSDLDQERHTLTKTKEKEVTYAIEKFNNDFEEVRKQIVNQVNTILSEMKARYLAEIRDRCSLETPEELKIKTSIDEFLGVINAHISGLKKGTNESIPDHYRQQIAKIVVKDFDSTREDIKNNIRKLKFALPYTYIDEKYNSNMRNDLQKSIIVEFGHKKESGDNRQESFQRPVSVPYSQAGDINLHENRDRLKKSFH